MDDDQLDYELVITMLEGVIQTQELIVQNLLRTGAIDKATLIASLERAAKKKDIRIGTQFPLLRMLDLLETGKPKPPGWKPRVIPGGKTD